MPVPSIRPGWQYCVMRLWCWCVVALAACTKPNPGVCCLDAADCASIGVSDPERPCDEGLACVNNACVIASCSTDGCTAKAPVCDITTDVCTSCTGPADCDQFDTQVCNTESGECVGCVEPTDCSAATPVCDANACRVCRLDSECSSGACGDNGTCVEEQQIVYMAPAGADQGGCERLSPCKSLTFAASKTSTARSHIVLATGSYRGGSDAAINSTTTSASRITIHGGSSEFTAFGDGGIMAIVEVPFTLRDIRITNQAAFTVNAITVNAPASRIERLTITNSGRLKTNGDITVVDSTFVNGSNDGIQFSGKLTVDRVVMSNVPTGIVAFNTGSIIDATNLMVSRSSTLALDLTNASGALRFSTIADSGTDSGTGPRAVACNFGLMVESTIVGAPGTTARAAIGPGPGASECPRSSTIAGPTPVTSAANDDPLFVDSAAGDYHLSAASPARDAVNAGPTADFEGDPRPGGARFDIGADEVR